MPNLTIRGACPVRSVSFEGTPLVREVLEAAGILRSHPCGGKGTCGKCAIRIEGALSPMTDAELRAGARLDCRTRLWGDAVLTLDTERFTGIETGGAATVKVLRPMPGEYGAAVDIGTTTMALKLYRLTDGTFLSEAAAPNPQRAFGADVISRIEAALAGKGAALREAVTGGVLGLLNEAREKAGISPDAVVSMVITGNTTMLYLLCGQDTECLSRAPWRAERLFGETLSLWGKTVYIPPCVSAFVGADLTCCLTASDITEQSETALLIDIGTNGEIALWHEGRLYTASAAAGPALEGAGISQGCAAVPGAIDKVWAAGGRLDARTVGGAPAVGICGSGIVDAAAALLDAELMDETGELEEDEIPILPGVALTQKDIRQIQLAKAAIAAGIHTLLKAADLTADDVRTLYIAGGFGKQINVNSAARIGLIPACLRDKARRIGNAALTGAAQMLLDTGTREKAAARASASRTVQLGGNGVFSDLFIEYMAFERN